MYAEEEFSVFASNLGLDTACMSGIIKIMEYVDFCNYGKDFLMGKIDDNRYYSKAHTVRVTIAAIALAELIWQVSLKNINIEKYLVDVLKDNKDREMIIELTKELLTEHIKRMEETLADGLYPTPVMLQILDYPDYDLEEYRLHIAAIGSLVNKL